MYPWQFSPQPYSQSHHDQERPFQSPPEATEDEELVRLEQAQLCPWPDHCPQMGHGPGGDFWYTPSTKQTRTPPGPDSEFPTVGISPLLKQLVPSQQLMAWKSLSCPRGSAMVSKEGQNPHHPLDEPMAVSWCILQFHEGRSQVLLWWAICCPGTFSEHFSLKQSDAPTSLPTMEPWERWTTTSVPPDQRISAVPLPTSWTP